MDTANQYYVVFQQHPFWVVIVIGVVLSGMLYAAKSGFLHWTSASLSFGRQDQLALKSLAGEWKGTFRTIRGRSSGATAEYTLMIVENMYRSCSGILLYEAYDPQTHKRVSAGADLLLPDGERYRPVSNAKWRPTFKRCVHWQPPEDPRPTRVKDIDEHQEHVYEWDVEVGISNDHARMKVRICAKNTAHESEGILEKHV